MDKVRLSGKYKTYPVYKDSGVEWLNCIPSEWTSLVLGRVLDFMRNGSSAPQVDEGVINDETVRVTRIETISNGIIDFNKIGYVRKSDISSHFLLQKGDIQISNINSLKMVGNCAIIEVDSNLYSGMNLLHVRPNDNYIFPQYMLYQFKTKWFRNRVEAYAKPAINQASIPAGSLKNFTFLCPSLEEQQKIASFLDHETAKIDTLIEKQQQLIKLLKEKRQAVISHAVTKGLNPNAPMRDSGVEWLGEVPEHWEVCKLKHIIAALDSGVSVNAGDVPAQSGELGVLKTSCVYTQNFRVLENKTVVQEEYNRVKCPIRKGAIIISRMNTPELVGASAYVDVEYPNIFLPDRLWQTVFKDETALSSKFIAYFMMIKGFKNQISLAAEGASSSMQNIAKGDYLAINIAFPELAEQITIVEHIEKMISDFHELEKRATLAIELSQERRTALISAAVTGKIDVRDWVAPESSNNTMDSRLRGNDAELNAAVDLNTEADLSKEAGL
jgi:type I restriction enzyme S subunit